MNTPYQMLKISTSSLLGLLGLTLLASPVAAQVFESGPSDRELFDNVLAIPTTDPNITNLQSAGGDEEPTIQINVFAGGTIGSSFDALSGSEINVRGGSVGAEFDAFADSEVNISGGFVEAGFDANAGSAVNISGGSVGNGFDAFSGSVVNISGGVLGDDFDAVSGSQINIFGSDFALDDVPLEEGTVTAEAAFTIEDRDVVLSGLYADGTPFSFDLNSTFSAGQDFFSTSATLTVTLGPPPGLIILGDVNEDGGVDFMDIGPFIQVLASAGFLDEADTNLDGAVNFLDIQSFIDIMFGN